MYEYRKETQPIQGPYFEPAVRPEPQQRGCCRLGGCLGLILALSIACLLLTGGLLFLTPQPSHLLILGIDRAPRRSFVGRSDSIILMRTDWREPYVGMLSIPRDLWVEVPGEGPDRINAAHYIAELKAPGTGGVAAKDTVSAAFGVPVHYYLRLRFQGLRAVVNAMGGVPISLPEPMGGLPAGDHHLDGKAAIQFLRHRSNDDDFARMGRGQLFIRAVARQALKPATWPELPGAISKAMEVIEGDFPPYQWPAAGLALLRVGAEGIDARTFNYDMVQPLTTSGGAAVLAPVWERIFPVVQEMFFR